MKRLIAAATLSAACLSVFAGQPADDALQHIQSIAAGDTALLARHYADDARLEWVGGPLDGTYNGAAAIGGVWERFTKAQGPLKVSVSDLRESVNPKGATVSANVLFEGKQPIKVRYVLVYRDGRLVGETWQIDPRLAIAASAS